MGKATAALLLERNIEVVIVARDTPQLSDTVNELKSKGKVAGIGLDLSSLAHVQEFAGKMQHQFLGLKYLVNAAGYFKPTAFLDHTEEDYDIYHAFNKAFFFITQAAARIMKTNGGGSIVNIGSMWAKQAINPFRHRVGKSWC